MKQNKTTEIKEKDAKIISAHIVVEFLKELNTKDNYLSTSGLESMQDAVYKVSMSHNFYIQQYNECSIARKIIIAICQEMELFSFTKANEWYVELYKYFDIYTYDLYIQHLVEKRGEK